MPAIGKIMPFCCLESICKFSFWTLKFTFPEYMKLYRKLFYTFSDILQQTFDKTKYGTTIFTNIDLLRM